MQHAQRILVTTLLVILILLALLFASGAANADTTIEAAKARKAWWFAGYLGWTVVHYGLGLSSVLLGILAASKSTLSADSKTKLTLCAAVAAAALTFLNPLAQGKAYHQAWHGIEAKIRSFYEKPAAATEAHLNAAIDAGEELIKKAGK